MDERARKKIARKVKRCEEILFKHQNIKTTVEPTNSLFIGNGGFGCGFCREWLMEIFRPFGVLGNIVMPLGEPYAFVVFLRKADAMGAMGAINGRSQERGQFLYMAYVANSDVPVSSVSEQIWPPGLILLEDFITWEEEADLIQAINCDDVEEEKGILKHRKVKHYGYEFVYGSNNIDKDKKLEGDIPEVCVPHLERLVALGHLPRLPDQLTVNHYQPGQGIPPHIDTHSAFEDGIVSISLGSQVVMDFYHPEKTTTSVLLPRRSVLIMLGESRYLWKHGIKPRKLDIYTDDDENCPILRRRNKRISLTFRTVLRGECHCEYKNQCDSLLKKESPLDNFVDNDEAQKLEDKYVNQVYEEIADHFSHTRYRPWPKVASFLASVGPGSFILDVGCGNGKNMKLSNGCFEVGCDASSNLAQVCLARGMEVLIADCLRLPFRDAFADVVICIAVIHHMSTKTRRSRAVQEILRVLSPGGRALVYVWAFEQETSEGQSKYLKRHSKPSDDDDPLARGVAKIEVCERASLPVHRNKTDFDQQDVLVPWNKSDSVCHRFYHVFVEGELDVLVRDSGGRIVDSYYDEGNWGVVFTK